MRRLSRRRALAILASGFGVGAAVEPGPAEAAATCNAAVTKIHKNVPKITLDGHTIQGTILESFACCTDAQAAILSGVPASARGGAAAPTLTNDRKTHLQPLSNQLALLPREALEEYCLMVWGLTEPDRDRLASTMRDELYKKPAPKE